MTIFSEPSTLMKGLMISVIGLAILLIGCGTKDVGEVFFIGSLLLFMEFFIVGAVMIYRGLMEML